MFLNLDGKETLFLQPPQFLPPNKTYINNLYNKIAKLQILS